MQLVVAFVGILLFTYQMVLFNPHGQLSDSKILCVIFLLNSNCFIQIFFDDVDSSSVINLIINHGW
jgi:hypothetical protein